jgi:nucleotidyltransferase substrate binding protein (TIGR01987 family)
MTADIRWQQRFSNYRKALAQLETFFAPPALNEREQQGLIKAFEYTYELAWNTLRDLLRSQGDATLLGSRDTLREAFRLGLIENGEAWMLMIQDRNLTRHTYNRSTADAIAQNISGTNTAPDAAQAPGIAGIPEARVEQLQALFARQPRLEAVWLFGSRAMGRHQPGSDIDLCLEGGLLGHRERLRLMAAVDDLLLPWRVDLVLRHELPADLEAHVQRVGRCIWTAAPPRPANGSEAGAGGRSD